MKSIRFILGRAFWLRRKCYFIAHGIHEERQLVYGNIRQLVWLDSLFNTLRKLFHGLYIICRHARFFCQLFVRQSFFLLGKVY